ncbi:hypothetical protein [Burkholderia ambifaria]|uniref:hypothetical protein n=1 Tax=Burkholderia ambifaria TaxID=152480 RepID=UPI001592602D|nr:hypothetical protein [Burkholderia ambifaria]
MSRLNDAHIIAHALEAAVSGLFARDALCMSVAEDAHGRRMIVCHYVRSDNFAIDLDELRPVLEARLGNDIYPQVLLAHDVMPTTEAGHIDRAYLQACAQRVCEYMC